MSGNLAHRPRRHGLRFTSEQALAIVPGICDALQSAHEQGVWHRDIKPENILLDRDGRVKIADFGIARLVGDPQRDFTLTMTGSAAYMSPEQHEKPHGVDHRADIYSLGVVITSDEFFRLILPSHPLDTHPPLARAGRGCEGGAVGSLRRLLRAGDWVSQTGRTQ